MPTATVIDHLKNYRARHGDEAWRQEVTRLATAAIRQSPKHEAFWKGICEGKDYYWVDWDEMLRLAKYTDPVSNDPASPSPDMQEQMLEAMKAQLPGLKTQAQLTAFMGCFEALQLTLNAIFEGDESQVEVGQKAINLALEVAVQATVISKQLEESPEAATSEAAEEFKTPALNTLEYDVQRKLMVELEAIEKLADLVAWYERTADDRNRITSQNLRNPLLDAIRQKKRAITEGL